MKLKKISNQYVICVQNQGYEVSLEKHKVYRVIADKNAAEHNLVKVIDESGRAYLYPSYFFLSIKLAQPILKALNKAA